MVWWPERNEVNPRPSGTSFAPSKRREWGGKVRAPLDYAGFWYLIALALLTSTGLCWAEQSGSVMESQADDYLLYMPENGKSYAGEKMNTTKQRSVTVVRDSPDEVVVDHFYHEGRFFRAVIPVKHIHRVIGESMNFTGGKIWFANHLQVRFILDDANPIKLYPNGVEISGSPLGTVSDFVYSVEGVGPEGKTFNTRDGIAGNLVKGHRLLSAEEMAYERVTMAKQIVKQTEVTNPKMLAHKEEYLRALLNRSQAEGMKIPFYLFRFPCGANNCTSNVFDPLDEILDYGVLNPLISFFHRYPIAPRTYARIRGVENGGDAGERRTLQAEIAQDPAWTAWREKSEARKIAYLEATREDRAVARSERRNQLQRQRQRRWWCGSWFKIGS